MPRVTNPPGARIATGTYTGDGSTSQPITGIGFAPKYVKIYLPNTPAAASEIYEKIDEHAGDWCHYHLHTAGNEHFHLQNRIISLDADGFTVDDSGADDHPNKNLQGYIYVCLG